MSLSAYPLSWPLGWKRTAPGARTRARFFGTGRRNFGSETQYRFARPHTMEESVRQILGELRQMNVSDWNVVISTNVALRMDGLPRSDRTNVADPGAAVYFRLGKRQAALACDKWDRVEDNLWAIGKHLEALRGQERWGVGNMEQAFAGYLRLAAPGESGAATWYNALGVAADCPFDVARSAYLEKAKQLHPDIPGGDADAMRALNSAWDQARQHFGR